MFDKWLIRVAAIGSALGGFAGFLYWAGIRPKDLAMTVNLPHIVWLIAGLLLFAVSILLSGYSIYRDNRKRTAEREGIAAIHAAEILESKRREEAAIRAQKIAEDSRDELMFQLATEQKASAELRLRKDEECAKWKTHCEKLQDENTALKQQIRSDDPRVYVRIEERRSGPYSKSVTTAFIVSNLGGSEARNVQLNFPTLSHLVTVEQLDVIQPNQTLQTFPELLQERWPDDRRNIFAAFETTSFKSEEDSVEGIMRFDMTITYENYNRTRRFVVPATVTYRISDASLKRNDIPLRHDRPVVEVAHDDCRTTTVV